MSSKKVLIYGSGGHASVVVDILKLQKKPILGIIEDQDKELWGKKVHGVKVLGRLQQVLLKYKPRSVEFFVAVGSNNIRKEIHSKLDSKGHLLARLVHPSAIVSKTAEIEAGALICAGSHVGPYVKIGRSVIINSLASIDHHCQIADFCHIAPGAILGGSVSVGARTLVGLGSKIKNNITIGEDVVVGLGSNVIQNLPSKIVAYGNPAQPVRELK